MRRQATAKRLLLMTPLGSQPWCPVAELADEFRRRGHAVTIAGDGKADTRFPWPAQYRPRFGLASNTTIRLNLSLARIGVLWVRDVRRFLRSQRADCILAWDPMVAVVCRLARRRGSTLVYVDSEYAPTSRLPRLQRAVAIATADSVVVASSAASTINMARHVVADPFDGPGSARVERTDGWVVFAGGVPSARTVAALADRRRQRQASAVVVDARHENELPQGTLETLVDASGAAVVDRVLDSSFLADRNVAAVVEPAALVWALDHRHRAALQAGIPVLVAEDVTLGPAVLASGVSIDDFDDRWRRLASSKPVVGDLASWALAALRDPALPRGEVVSALGVDVAQCPMCLGENAYELRRLGPTSVVRCETCGLTYGTPKVPDEVVFDAGYHDGSGRFGTDYFGAEWYCNALSDDRLRFLRESGVEATSIIDIGTGLGHFVERARQHNWHCDGLELVPEAVEGARRLFGIELINEPVTDFVPSAKYDVAALGQTLEHFTRPVDVLEHIRKEVIRPGGAVLIEVPNLDGFPRRVRRNRWTHWQIGDHVTYFNARTLAELLSRAGFDVVKCETTTGVFRGLGAVGVAYGLGIFDPLTAWGSALRTGRRIVANRRARRRPTARVAPPATPPGPPENPVVERILLTVADAIDRSGYGDHVRVVAVAR